MSSASNRAAHLAMAQHYEQHQHCPGFDGGRYHRDLDYRCPHCEGNTTPPVRSQWRAMAAPQAPGEAPGPDDREPPTPGVPAERPCGRDPREETTMPMITPEQRLTNVLHALRTALERPPHAGQKAEALQILTQLEGAWQQYQAGTLAALDDTTPF